MTIDEDITTLKHALKSEEHSKCNQYIKMITQKMPSDSEKFFTLSNLQGINKFNCTDSLHRRIITTIVSRYGKRKELLPEAETSGITIPGTNGIYHPNWTEEKLQKSLIKSGKK